MALLALAAKKGGGKGTKDGGSPETPLKDVPKAPRRLRKLPTEKALEGTVPPEVPEEPEENQGPEKAKQEKKKPKFVPEKKQNVVPEEREKKKQKVAPEEPDKKKKQRVAPEEPEKKKQKVAPEEPEKKKKKKKTTPEVTQGEDAEEPEEPAEPEEPGQREVSEEDEEPPRKARCAWSSSHLIDYHLTTSLYMYIKYINIYVHMNVTYDDLFFNKDLGNYNQATADNLPIGAYIITEVLYSGYGYQSSKLNMVWFLGQVCFSPLCSVHRR